MSMVSKQRDELSRLQVEQSHSSVYGSRGETSSISAHRKKPNESLMPLIGPGSPPVPESISRPARRDFQ